MSAELFSLAMNEISDRYIEEALTYQAPATHFRVKPLLRMALAACLALIMALGTAMAVSAEFREAVVGWIKEQYETWTHYEYREEEETGKPDADINEIFVPHYLTEVPPGYTEIVNDINMEIGQQLIVYQNEENGNMCFAAASIHLCIPLNPYDLYLFLLQTKDSACLFQLAPHETVLSRTSVY